MSRKAPTVFKGIKDVFYEARVLRGREYTLKRFATEVLGGAVDPVMLSYIEKGARFPSEALVRRLAEAQGNDPQEWLILLWQDRMIHAFGRELARAFKGGKNAGTTEGSEDLAWLISRAIAALPDDGTWMPVSTWRRTVDKAVRSAGNKSSTGMVKKVVGLLKEQDLIEISGQQVRRLGRHYVARGTEERQAMAREFCGIFARSLLDKVLRQGRQTYVRNHYLQIPEARLEEFYRKLDELVRSLVEASATEDDAAKFLNILITSTPS